MNIIKKSIPLWNYKNKCPRITAKSTITIHNTGNTASAINEASYMVRNTNKVSFHAVVDENEVVECIPFNRSANHCANWSGNNSSYSIEIARSTNSDTSLFLRAERNAAEYVATLLKSNGWGVDRLRTHKYWNGKNCPHKTLALGWERFKNMVQEELNKIGNSKNTKTEKTNDELLKIIERDAVFSKEWHNGSTKEVVFEDTRLKKEIGLLFPYEKALCLKKTAGTYLVEYIANTPNGKAFKVGYVRYHGGVK